MRADNEPRTKRPKNKQDRPAMSDSEDIPSNDRNLQQGILPTTPTPDGVPSIRFSSNESAGVPVPSPWSLRVRESSANLSSRLRLHLPTNPAPTDQAEASINGPN
jgi:hypothetical protein